MSQTLETEVVKEGTTEVFVLKHTRSKKGPGAKQGAPFYNPAMEANRDLSVLVAQWLVRHRGVASQLLDGLAASGIRGVRLANEVDGEFDVTINDWDEDAFILIKKNIHHNNLTNACASNKNVNALLLEHMYHYIDVDPFGSPAYFIDAAVRSIHNNGVIACTATDTATLCGVYPKVCLRRYGAQPLHSVMMHEIGLRILLGFLCREAAKYEKGIEPLVCYACDHYYRVYVRVKNGKRYANRSVDALSRISSNQLTIPPDEHGVAVGPLWIGKLHTKNIVKKLRTDLFTKQLNTKHELWKMLSLFEEEAKAPPFFYTTESIASNLKIHLPRREHIFEKIREKGYAVWRTQFMPTGFKTTAPFDEIIEIFQELNTQ